MDFEHEPADPFFRDRRARPGADGPPAPAPSPGSGCEGGRAASRPPAEEVRRRIMEAVGAVPLLAQPGRAGLGVFLSLLQDRLPVYAASMAEALGRPGRRSVRENLTLAARATVDFYGEVLPAQAAVLASPEQTAGLRQLTRAGDLGPHHAERMVADYLEAERRFGRVSPEVDALAVAHLLLGGCLGYVFNAVLQGREDLPGAAEYTAAMVRALDLGL